MLHGTLQPGHDGGAVVLSRLTALKSIAGTQLYQKGMCCWHGLLSQRAPAQDAY